MSEKNQPTTTGPHLIATFDTVEDVARSMDQEDREALLQSTTYMHKRLEKCARLYDEYGKQMESDFQAMLDAGCTESVLSGSIVPPAELVAQQLQGEAGNGPVGGDLVKRLRGVLQDKPVRVAALLSGLSQKAIRNRLEGKPVSVDEAARLAVACGITTGELLGFVDADEVILLRLWRDMDQSKREALLCLLS